ncbi:hypothetical protein GCM10010269_26420 [Streptomyces humidus]|uniref:Uncharacterized protein n=1 Tax=Streptomyces humidus TaxID=52259 RepID=A0A918FUB2_9ACTN|nr:hypothetical protein GCM10010269_26420 [Streptomyces humidus]
MPPTETDTWRPAAQFNSPEPYVPAVAPAVTDPTGPGRKAAGVDLPGARPGISAGARPGTVR